jgi:hypothetical protein
MCLHAGQAMPTVPNPRVKVSGQPTLQQPNPWTITGCPFTTGGNPMPCVTAQWVTSATRVLSGGMPLLLQDSVAVCAPNGTGVTVIQAQMRVKGI